MICQYCGAGTSKFGLGLVHSVLPDGTPAGATCVECGQARCRNWFPLTMQSIFEMVDRVPWVPTERELAFWKLWDIERWFARRT